MKNSRVKTPLGPAMLLLSCKRFDSDNLSKCATRRRRSRKGLGAWDLLQKQPISIADSSRDKIHSGVFLKERSKLRQSTIVPIFPQDET